MSNEWTFEKKITDYQIENKKNDWFRKICEVLNVLFKKQISHILFHKLFFCKLLITFS